MLHTITIGRVSKMHEALIIFIFTQQGSNLDIFRVKLSNTPVILLWYILRLVLSFSEKTVQWQKASSSSSLLWKSLVYKRQVIVKYFLIRSYSYRNDKISHQNWGIAIILIVFRLNNQKILLTWTHDCWGNLRL